VEEQHRWRGGNGGSPPPPPDKDIKRPEWSGSIPPLKWMLFYNRVLAKYVSGSGLSVSVKVEAAPAGGLSKQRVEETRIALRELGLDDEVTTS
jgi:hypothetical protein